MLKKVRNIMITLKNIRVKGNLIYCEMYQDGSGDPIELVFEFINLDNIKLKEIKLDGGIKNLRDFGQLCWY